MRETRLMMGMPICVEIVDADARDEDLEAVFAYFDHVDQQFSPFKPTSEVSKINQGELDIADASSEMQEIVQLAERTRLESIGYFNVMKGEVFDPSGVVKGWAILNAADLLKERGFRNYFVDAGGDIQAQGLNSDGEPWCVGIRSPFNLRQVVRLVSISDMGIATSGSYVRGAHIYNPRDLGDSLQEVLSLTVIGPDIVEADRFATAAFAMGRSGIAFIEWLDGLEGYMIDRSGIATYTSRFERFVL